MHMNKKEIYTQLFSYNWPQAEELINYANSKKGYGGDDGCYGVTYPSDLDEYDREVEKIIIPEGYLEINYWHEGNQDIHVTEKEYILELKKHLISTGNSALTEKLKNA